MDYTIYGGGRQKRILITSWKQARITEVDGDLLTMVDTDHDKDTHWMRVFERDRW